MTDKPTFSAIALTLFPEMFPGTLGHSLAGKALEKGLWSLEAINIRDFATDKHKTVDASPYGGGTGMVMKPDVVDAAIEHVKEKMRQNSSTRRGEAGRGALLAQTSQASPLPNLPPKGEGISPLIIYTTPRGRPFTQQMAKELVQRDIIILCGRFEGVDQRVIDHHQMLEISLGDFVLSGGEIAAQAILDACVRLIPGVIGKDDAITQESFGLSSDFARLLEYPHYTRPPLWNGLAVPEVLLSGNHEHIQNWRLAQAKEITATRRPDLLKKKDE